MEQLTSNPTYTIYISGYEPVSSSYTLYQKHSIQGTTNLVFNLTGVNIGTYGFYRIQCKTPTVNIFNISPSIVGTSVSLSTNLITHTYYPDYKNDYITVDVFYRNGYKTTFGITLCTVAENILDKDLTILNTQMFYSNNKFVPILNLESNENTIYPIGYSDIQQQQAATTVIYLKTDPEQDVSLTAFSVLSSSNIINTENSNRIYLT
jgi:hypothetical protein